MKKLEHHMSARRDFRVYALLIIGVIFVVAGFAADPAKNCDESGRDCAPWVVYVGRVVGVLAVLGGLYQLIQNRRWGSRLDIARRRLYWRDSAIAPGAGSIALEEIAAIKIQRQSEDHDWIEFFAKGGQRIPFPKQQALPYDAVEWSTDLRKICPHFAITVDSTVLTRD